MPSEHRLAGNASTLLSVPADSEIFCATGALHLSSLPRSPGALPQRLSITAGQSWRAQSGTLVTLEAIADSRYTLNLPRAPSRPPGPENKNASDWNRLASWMRRRWLLWAGHAGAR